MQVHILYATVSGNAERLAHVAAEELVSAGYDCAVRNLADFPVDVLRDTKTVLLIVSTWGEGAPPPDAGKFCAALASDELLDLSGLRYAVLALGSSSYVDFCACGRRLDADLARRGATRLVERVDCDTKLKSGFERWLAAVRAVLEKSA